MEPVLKILLIDDNAIDRETCRRFLGRSTTQSYEFLEKNNIEGSVAFVAEQKPDCILLDYHLHDGTGVEFLIELQTIGGPRVYPVIMVTGTGSESIAVEAMKAGAQDYIIKGSLTPDILQRAVSSAIYKARTERLLDQQQAELERLFQEAKDANARKDHFLAALSHELRTPLTPVLAAVSSANVENSGPQDLRRIFSMIRRNIELEARLIDDMLDLTRIASGKLELDRRKRDVHGILHHATETCREEIDAKGLELQWELEAADHHALVDSARLQQIFWNLLKNSVKFTPAGGRITLASRNVGGDRIEIAVSDTGIGIDADNLPKIFDAFEQASLKITRQYGGLGLGLAICKALMDAHGGTIRVTSDGPGTGTCFTVGLDVLEVDLSAAVPPEPAVESAPASGDSLTLMLVEDHEESAFLLSHLMEMNGYKVHVAGTVEEAVRVFQSRKIDGIVSDIGLPDGTGLDMLRRVREIRKVPSIALSGFGMEHDQLRSQQAGFDLHITKPVDWPRLQAAIESLFRAPGDGDAAGNGSEQSSPPTWSPSSAKT